MGDERRSAASWSLIIANAALACLWAGLAVLMGVALAVEKNPDAGTVIRVTGQIAACLPFALLYGGAAKGLLAGRQWGMTLHMIGAVPPALTCVGLIYAIPAVLIALRDDVKADLAAARDQEPPPEARGER